MDIPHRTLRWEGEKPRSGIQDAARKARYALLVQAAQEAGARFILTGHTLEDQAETLEMRLARQPSGIGGAHRGLAGMAAASLLGRECWLVRPLLGVRRAMLRALLAAAGIGWTDDPSNDDVRFERVRVRNGMGQKREKELFALQKLSAAYRVKEAQGAAELLRKAARRPLPGLVQLSAAELVGQPAAAFALRLLLAVVGGREHLLDECRAAQLLEWITAARGRRNIAGVLIDAFDGRCFLTREQRGVRPVVAHKGAVFDGRYEVLSAMLGVIEPAGSGGLSSAEVEKAARELGIPRSAIRSALSAEPVLRLSGEELPAIGAGERLGFRLAPFAQVMPGFDHAAAAALCALFDMAELPVLPYAPHTGGSA